MEHDELLREIPIFIFRLVLPLMYGYLRGESKGLM